MKRPTFISLFSGIGGFDLGLERAGWKCVAQVEFDKPAAGVLAHRFPGVPIFNDVTTLEPEDLPDCQLLTYGFPCQDLSVAGKREGLGGERSGLFYEATRLLRGLLARGCGLQFAVAENVPGLLSADDGTALSKCIGELADIGHRESGWTILDSQHFGVPQRRRRVFIVTDFTGERTDQVLSISESLRGHPTQSQEKGQGVAADAGGGVEECGVPGEVAGTLDRKSCAANRGSQANETEFLAVQPHEGLIPDVVDGQYRFAQDIVGALSDGAHMGGGLNGQDAHTGRILPVLSTKPTAFHASQDPISSEDRTPALGANAIIGIKQDLPVRRLTPTECERLQGFPDEWTGQRIEMEPDGKRWRSKGEPHAQADGSRYRQLGNAVTVNVAEWLGGQLKKALN